MLKNDLFLRAARRERTERTPVWLMRQAGRTDPAYQSLRRRADVPLEAMFRDADLAIEASLLPVRIGLDAVIMFQDILTPLGPMGADFTFRPGPRMPAPLATAADIDNLRGIDPASDLDFVGGTIRGIRKELDGNLPVIGFAGAPLTLAFFLLSGGSPGPDARLARAALRSAPADIHRLLDKLTAATILYLEYQILEGVDAFQVFESVADLLTAEEYAAFAHPYQARIFSELGGRVPGILFAKEHSNVTLLVETGADVLSIGRSLDLADCRALYGSRVAFQGNVDAALVAHGTPDQITEAVRHCVRAGDRQGHILNLNQGLLKDTPFAKVRRVVEATRQAGRELYGEVSRGVRM